jgi:hypothetical protein
VTITAASGALGTGAVGAGVLAFGRVVELPGEGRGVPTGYVRIDLDKKDNV